MPDETPEICSCSSLRQAARHVTRFYDDALAPIGLSLNQYSILSKLERLGPQSVQGLSDVLVTDRSTLGHLLKPLERRFWIEIDVDTNDRRQRVVKLTAAGQQLVDAARPRWERAQKLFEHAFGTAQAAALRHLMRTVTTTKLSSI